VGGQLVCAEGDEGENKAEKKQPISKRKTKILLGFISFGFAFIRYSS
jgi:hypothetical protein